MFLVKAQEGEVAPLFGAAVTKAVHVLMGVLFQRKQRRVAPSPPREERTSARIACRVSP